MILLKMEGGLGNQMFQYAFGKAASTTLGVPLVIDSSWYKDGGKRKFLLKDFNISLDEFEKNALYIKILTLFKRPSRLHDKGYFEAGVMDFKDNTLFIGWWESQKYFANIENEIRDKFVLKNPSEKFTVLAKNIQKGSISMHVRRGDYLVPHGKYLNGLEYYKKALKNVLEDKPINNPQITIFSDDPELCKKEMDTILGIKTEVFQEKLASDAEEMMFMSLYENNIIGNSTFSWWAAFLNRNVNKIVVMPKNWFTDQTINQRYVSGISVDGWRMIE